jgi:Tol biopolymer transport system component
MLYRVVFEGANLIKMSLVMATAVLAICLLAFAGTAKKAEAGSLPQNGKIAFSRTTSSGEYGIYAVDPDGSDLSLLTNKAGAPPAWSPDGTKIAFQRERSIWVTDPDGSNLRVLTTNKVDADDYPSDPAWSPDGTRIAFDSHVTGDYEVYTINVDSADVTNITNTPQIDEIDIDLSPDGSQLCLYRSNRRWEGEEVEKEGIYVMNVDTSNPIRLTTEPPTVAGECAWSPDGKKIAYTAESNFSPGGDTTATDVYVMNADGSKKTNLTKTGTDSGPEWSPDGTEIAFSSSRGGDSDIYTMDSDGSNVTQVTTDPGANDTNAGWQPLPKATVHQPDTGGPSLLLVAIALLFSGGTLLYAGLRRSM